MTHFTSHPLASLTWHRLKVVLRNVRMVPSSEEHPISIMQGILKDVSQRAGVPGSDPIFHIADMGLDFKISQGTLVPLEIFFCRADRRQVEHWIATLQHYLTDLEKGKNYDLANIGAIDKRTLAAVAEDVGAIQDKGEICLDFLTPLPFSGRGGSHYHLIPEVFTKAFESRIKELFGLNIPYSQGNDDFELLPYCWQYANITHKSKSNDGDQLINGCVGPLYIRGSFSNLLPFIVLGAELHAGGKKSNSQGYYKILSPALTFFTEKFISKRTLRNSINKIRQDKDYSSCLPDADTNISADVLSVALKDGNYEPLPNAAFIHKSIDGLFHVHQNDNFSDLVIQESLHELLYEIFKKVSDGVAIGHRNATWRNTETDMMDKAAKKNFNYVVETEIANPANMVNSFDILQCIAQYIPDADETVKSILTKIIKRGFNENGIHYERKKSFSKESLLAPLLMDFYLATYFDTQSRKWSGHMIRYGNRVVFMDADQMALDATIVKAVCILETLGLQLREERRYFYERHKDSTTKEKKVKKRLCAVRKKRNGY